MDHHAQNKKTTLDQHILQDQDGFIAISFLLFLRFAHLWTNYLALPSIGQQNIITRYSYRLRIR